jgi:hypothetical protein
MGAYRTLQHGAMASQGILHRIGMPLNERRRPFDIGEEKSDGSAGKGIHDERYEPFAIGLDREFGAPTHSRVRGP